MTDHTSYAPEVQQALTVARSLAQIGVPVFLLQPDPTEKTGYKTPKSWQNTNPDPSVIDRWEPGMGIAAVTGFVFDVIDVDPRNKGSIEALDGAIPTVYAKTSTPSGGAHFWIKSLGLPKGVISEGLDYQGGSFSPNSSGTHSRGFVFLPPTARVSKVDGAIYAYAWKQMPPPAMTPEYMSDESGHQLALNIRTKKQKEASDAKQSYCTEVDEFLRSGIPMGKQHYILSRIAYDMVARKQGDMHIMLTMKAILSRSQQDMADPWTDEALNSLIYSARSKLDKNAIFDTWMIEETINLISRQREEDGGDPKLPSAIQDATRRKMAEREAKRRVDAEEAAREWRGWGDDEVLADALSDDSALDLDYMFGRVMSKDDNVLLAAKFKTGKTTMLGTFIKAILDGTPFLSEFEVHDDVDEMRVGIWNCEMTRKGFLSYMKNSGIRNGHKGKIHHLRGHPVPFMSNELAREKTVEWLAENNIQIWVIDSWSILCAWNKVDMNDNSEVMRLCAELDSIKQEAGVRSIILTAHSPKSELEGEESAIGAQNLSGWADTIMMLVREKDKRFVWSRGRCDLEIPETEVLMNAETGLVELGEGSREDHRQQKKQQAQTQKTIATEMGVKTRIIEYLTDNPGAGSTDIRKGVTGDGGTIGRVLKDMIAAGEVVIVPVKKGVKAPHFLPGQERNVTEGDGSGGDHGDSNPV